jgi:hypothetical protein
MTDTIICTAIRQPSAFYQNPSSFSVAVNLNFDCRTPESDPKGRFETFLKALPDASFRVYRLAFEPLPSPQPPAPSPLPPTWPFQPAAWTASTDYTPSKATPVANIMNWLDRRGSQAAGTPAPTDHWLTAGPPSTATFKLTDLKATHHLGTAFAWPAPIPQDGGLVRIVTLKPTTDPAQTDHLLVVIPFFDGATADFTPTNFKQGDNGILSFTYNAGTDFPTATAEIRLIDDPVSAASSLVDGATGFLTAPAPADTSDADQVAAILQQIESRSASLLWAYPPIHAVTWPSSDDETIGRLVWRAMSGIAALLDPVVLSLSMLPPPAPASDSQKGPFVSALIACVDKRWTSSPAPDSSGIAKFVRDGLQALLWPQESVAGQRSALVNTIASLFKLDIGTEKQTAATATGIIPLLLGAYGAQSPDQLTPPSWFGDAKKRFGSLEVALSNELGALAQTLQADGGIEDLVLALFEAIGLFDKSGKTGGGLATCTNPQIGQDIAKSATALFRNFMGDNFNALDAARHAQAGLYELHLVAAASAPKAKPAGGVAERWTAQDLEAAIEGARWFTRRIDPTKGSTFDAIGKALPIWAAAALTSADREALVGPAGPQSGGALGASFELVYSELVATGDDRRFLPDHAPRTLQIQIAVDSDASDVENFVQAYNGFGVLLRRVGGNWAYGDLAELKIYQTYDVSQKNDQYQDVVDPAHPERELITVAPLQPATIDGQRRLFLNYDGHPFASQAFAMTSAAGNSSDGAVPFYKYNGDPPSDLLNPQSFALCPALAYGATYEAAAFVVGKGGALPLGVQGNGLLPWAPSNTPAVPPPTGGRAYSRTFPYQRTTAIGRVSLNEIPKPGLAKRIGVGIDGVQPLFRDHPRVGLSSPVNGSAALDILRNADGTGAFSLPQAGNSVSLSLPDLWWWGSVGASGGTLTLAFFAQPGPKPKDAANRTSADDPLLAIPIRIPIAAAVAAMAIEIDSTPAPAPNEVTLTFIVQFAGTQVAKQSTTVPASVDSIWIRTQIAASDPTKIVSLSLTDPATQLGGNHVTSHPTPDSLLLIAPAGASEWRAPYTDAVNADILLPRVGFNDFDRWLNNDSLAAEAATGQPPSDGDKTRLSTFFATLMAAYILRNTDQNLAPLLERLPDLAVDQLLVELTPLDALYDPPSNATSYQPSTTIGVISQVIPLRTFGARLNVPPAINVDDLPNIVANLLTLSGRCAVGLQIKSDASALSVASSGDNVKDAALTVVVPRGMVARLTIRPMVPAKYLEDSPSIFHPGIATLATEIRDSHYIFEGASIVIESMVGALASASDSRGKWQDRIDSDDENRCYDWEDLAAAAVVVRPAGAHRSYDLVAQPQAIAAEPTGWRWRQLANIDIDTQRWRFTGRPIYSWLDPTKRGQSSSVAIEQKWSDGDTGTRDEIVNFETESFFDRDDADADSQTMLLNPLGATLLQSFPWEQPSATYFRHRLTIRSRYEGALSPKQVAAQRVWGGDDDHPPSAARSWIRVAMLADRTQLQLTRPQLRALIPLTRAPELPDDDLTLPATPPVMAILDERPFAHGGLADRIAAEIRTGLGYVLPTSEPLQILDARKEFGPDPRLTYTPTPADKASAVTLRNEGPIGLTFDSDTVRAPIFANTALILHPTVMIEGGAAATTLEEHFLSVGLRRYLDPAWLTGGTTSSFAIADSLWIETTDPTFTLAADTAPRPLIKVSVAGASWVVQFDWTQIDSIAPPAEGSPPPPPPADPFKTLCTVQQDLLSGLAFLHSPLEKGRASLSVFAIPSGSTGDAEVLAGTGNQALMMASIEWQVAAGAVNLKAVAASKVSLTSASPTTLMNWTRTGKNFEIWHSNNGTTLVPYNVSNVVARRTGNNSACVFVNLADNQNLSFEPERSRYPNPLYVHRHHAIIATGHAPGIGRPVEVFISAFRAFGGSFVPPGDAQAVRLVEFETPAQPLALLPQILPNSPLNAFSKAHFDLISILNRPSPLQPGFVLFIRPLGGDVMNKALTKLSLNLNFIGSTSSSYKFDLSIPHQNIQQGIVRGVLLVCSCLTNPSVVTYQVIYAGGTHTDATPVQSPTQLPQPDFSKLQAIELEIAGLTASGVPYDEFWTDISLLMKPTGSDDFTFDWFFAGNETQSPAEAVTATALLDMVEAQARIIAVSPSIPIQA